MLVPGVSTNVCVHMYLGRGVCVSLYVSVWKGKVISFTGTLLLTKGMDSVGTLVISACLEMPFLLERC